MSYTIELPPKISSPRLSPSPLKPGKPGIPAPEASEKYPELSCRPPTLSPVRVAQVLELSLAEFAAQDCVLQVKVPWLPETLWFVPTRDEGVKLLEEGVSRGRVWTANELANLLALGDVSREEVQQLTRLKCVFDVSLFRIRRPASDQHEFTSTKGSSSGVNHWPEEIVNVGKHTVGPLDHCTTCGEVTWSHYGSLAFCSRHAREEASDADCKE